MQPVLSRLEQQHKQAEGQGEKNGAEPAAGKKIVSTASSILF